MNILWVTTRMQELKLDMIHMHCIHTCMRIDFNSSKKKKKPTHDPEWPLSLVTVVNTTCDKNI